MKQIKNMTLDELEQFIGEAMAEYSARIREGAAIRRDRAAFREDREPMPERLPVKAPSSEDQGIVKKILSMLRAGRPIYADEVRDYRRIVGEFPDWAKRHGYPDDVRGASKRRYLR